MTAVMATVAALLMVALVWVGASVLGVMLAIVLVAALLACVVALAIVRLARSREETRRWGHQVVATKNGSQVLADGRRIEFLRAVEAAITDEAQQDGAQSPEDANLIAARRHGRIEREVSRP